jgi:uncharacterized membrane-anchored protein YhcB (DUF1043 family)
MVNVMRKTWILALLGLVAGIFVFAGSSNSTEKATAASPGAT